MLKILKKRKSFSFLVYGRFLSISIASMAPITIMTMMMDMIPYMRVVFEAKPDCGVDIGVVVVVGLTSKVDAADDHQ